MRHPSAKLTLILFLLLASVPLARGEDWPTYRGGSGRAGASDEDLATSPRLRWSRELSPPSPAWPPPARGSYWQNLSSIEPRVVDDHADHPIIAAGSVFIGSSRDDHVRCIDLETGRLTWSFATGGPVRFAPVAVGDSVCFGSDDGFVYCVDAASGAERWRRRLGPEGDLIAGNGRLISPRPVRVGIVTDGRLLYAAAGLFPSQGVLAAALDVETGEPEWERRLEHSPQGYLLLAGEHVIVPTGRGTPISLDRETGADGPSMAGVGGTYAVVEGDRVVSGRGNDGTLAAASSSTGERIVQFPGRHLAVSGTHSYLLGRGQLAAVKRSGAGVRWTVAVEDAESLAVVGDQVLVGGEGRVRRFEAATGNELPPLGVSGRALGVAASNGSLVITTDLGGMYCFGIDSGEEPDVLAPARAAREPEARGDEVGKLLASLESPRGYALIVGDENPVQLARGLVHQSALHVVIAASGATAVAEVRSALTPLGQYGDRIAVVEAAGDRLPFADYLFNLVVAGSGAGVSRAEIERVCVPGRGRIAENGRVRNRPALPGAGSWTHQFGNLGNSANSGDRYTTGRVELQWFGGPGPDRMIDRHMRGPPPLAADGLLFIVGENRLIGVDSYNGTELWDVELPDSQRYAMPYDAGYIAAGGGQVFAAVDAELWRIDAATGEVRSRFSLPAEIGRGRHAGYVGVDGDEVYISATLPTAHRTEPGRELADTSYKSVRPVVTARAFARLDARTGRAEWTRDSGAIVQPTITVTPEAVCFVESRGEAVRRHETGRIDLPTLLTSDAWLVALSRESGETIWELPLELPGARNILYLQHDGGRLVLTASEDSAEGDAYYHIRVLDALDGSEFWRSEHGNLKPGELYHGEQVHHPVILGDLLVAEPYVYNLESGARVNPDGGDSAWTIRRPGHSCGTMSGSAECLFFRANNPTVLDLGAGVTGSDRFRTLAPSRVGCWINILPVDGLVLVPESSASCVCHYSLQTSMGFRPAR